MAIYRSSRGTPIDLDALRMKQETSISVGNTKTNARGDYLGTGGKIEKSADDIAREHYNKNNPRAVKKTSIKVDDEKPSTKNTTVEDDLVETTADHSENSDDEIKEETVEVDGEEWLEDDDGNFVKKEHK